MKIDYKHSETQEPYGIDVSGVNIELREVFNGVTFVADGGERLSISMRDYGFEAHYYREETELYEAFDAGWFRFSAGAVNDDKPEPDNEPMSLAVRGPSLDERLDCWIRASVFADKIIESHPVEAYKVIHGFGSASTMTAAEQRANLVRDIADWLMGNVNG